MMRKTLFTFIYSKDLCLYDYIRELSSIFWLKLPNTPSLVIWFNSIHTVSFIGKKGDTVNTNLHLTPVLHGLPARLPKHFKALELSGLQLSYKQPLHPWSMLWVGAVVSQEPRIHCVPRVSSCLTLPPGNRKSLSWTVLRAVCKLFWETMADDSSGTVINDLGLRLTDLP